MRCLFTMEQQEGSEERCAEMWAMTGRRLPEGCGNEALGSEKKLKEGPPSQVGLPGKSP